MTGSTMRPLKDLIPEALGELTVSSKDVRHLSIAWTELAGPLVARHCQPSSIEDGHLTITCDSESWCEALAHGQPELRKKLQEELGFERISFIVAC